MKRLSTILLLASLAILAVGCSRETKYPVTEVSHPEWAESGVIYEVNVRQYTPEGTFAAFSKHLDRLSDLGVKILWLMPINPIGEYGRKGSLGSYYSVRDYYAVNPEFGNMNDFKALVDSCHVRGFKVVMDWVANHTSRDCAWTAEHPKWYKRSGDTLAVAYDWTDVALLDYANDSVRDAMIDAMSYWVKEGGIDGFRCDFASGPSVSFWNKCTKVLRSIKPDIFLLAEAEQPDLQEKAFDAYYSWQLMNCTYDLAAGKITADSLANFFLDYENNTGMPLNTIPMHFTTNHDQNSWHGTDRELYGDALKQFAVLSFVLPGMPMIYSGEEVSMDRRLRFFEKDTIDWSNDVDSMTVFYSNLISERNEHKCLWAMPDGGKMYVITNDRPKKVFSMERELEGDICLALFNFSDSEVTCTLGEHAATADSLFDLPAYGYRLIFSAGDPNAGVQREKPGLEVQ
ncbi:MAG: alpha-amylase family glycosyl hydrolase [Bacteroidales bacterium]|jgi:glycosidase|nr:alpha-amylase family glycosyl hydrolase [Bacteroidales bacterium]MCI2121332.1 alpha-amylase family glycosyl hydrolase [Bacteroidales bacterium]MCI2145917.1 alpha-amylase family glycosyl hydrolase [Bacteroidales bacterium]